MRKNVIYTILTVTAMTAVILTGCGKKAGSENNQPTRPDPILVQETESENEKDPILGTYKLYNFMGMSRSDYADMNGMESEDAAKESFTCTLNKDRTADMTIDGKTMTIKFSLHGKNIRLYEEGEKEQFSGTVDNGVMTLSINNVDIVLLKDNATPPEITDPNNASWTAKPNEGRKRKNTIEARITEASTEGLELESTASTEAAEISGEIPESADEAEAIESTTTETTGSEESPVETE